MEDAAGNDFKVEGTTVMQNGNWYHVVGTWDGTTFSIFVNGVKENSVSAAFTPDTNNLLFYLERPGRKISLV